MDVKNIKWIYKTESINELKENPYNPRRMSKHKAQKLKESIQKFGQCKPINITQEKEVIGGHQRLHILRALGFNKVDVAISPIKLTKREKDKLSLSLNKIHGEDDDEMLANYYDPALLLEVGYLESELTGYLESEEKPKTFSINIKFKSEDDLRFIEDKLNVILSDFPEATMKVKCK